MTGAETGENRGPQERRFEVVLHDRDLDGVLAAMRVMGATITPLEAQPQEPAVAESGEALEPLWVGVDDFVGWAAAQEGPEGYDESGGSYWGKRAWSGALRVVVAARHTGEEPPLKFEHSPDNLDGWQYRQGDFGRLDLRSMVDFIADMREEAQRAGKASDRAFDAFLQQKLPNQVGPGTFFFWEKFTQSKISLDPEGRE